MKQARMGIQFVFLGLMSFLSSCIHVSTPVKLRVGADAALNHDSHHASLPVVLKVYQLKEEQQFKQASFEDLWKKDKVILSDALVSSQEYIIYPGKTERYQFLSAEGACYLGLVATFRMPEADTWKTITRIPQGMTPKSIHVNLKDNQLSLSR